MSTELSHEVSRESLILYLKLDIVIIVDAVSAIDAILKRDSDTRLSRM